jgi:hypothetical protein
VRQAVGAAKGLLDDGGVRQQHCVELTHLVGLELDDAPVLDELPLHSVDRVQQMQAQIERGPAVGSANVGREPDPERPVGTGLGGIRRH